MPSEAAKHLASLTRVATTDHKTWQAMTKCVYPKANCTSSTDGSIEYYTVHDVEGEVALWSVEHQMGYVIL